MTFFRKALATVSLLPATVFIVLIRIYQKTISPDHGWMRHLFPYGCCRHEPTCSMYAIDQLKKRSFPMALLLIIKRIASCHPWAKTTDEKILRVIQKRVL